MKKILKIELLIKLKQWFVFQYFWCCTQSGDQSQEDLIIFGYKTNRYLEEKKILLYFVDLLEPTI